MENNSKKLSKKSIEEKYKKLSHREHVLQRPDTYIGSIQTELKEVFIVQDIDDLSNIKMTPKIVNFNPGFLKIFDEILVNASDQFIRTGKVKYIKININEDSISVENDGPGIPIELHKEHNVYVPELIFGHLLTGTNYDDNEDRLVGGKNGLGAKLTNIFSKKFIIDTADGKQSYHQEFTNNMQNIGKAETKKLRKNYTKITYYPDFERFGLDNGITEEIKQVLLKRIIDVAVYTKIKVYFNDEIIPIQNFEDFIKLHTDNDEIFYENLNDGWEVGVSATNIDEFQQVSLVNGITTYQGGTHVNFITNQIIKELKNQLEKKHKKVTIKENDIKSKLFIFLNSKIINPDFDTQSKESLKTRLSSKHVGNVHVSPKLIKSIMASDIIEDIMNYIQIKERAALKKLNSGKRTKIRVRKLDDANKAGTNKSEECSLAITEGDSAKSFCIAGFSVVGRDKWGVFPLKGKSLNVRGENIKRVMENEELKNIVSALGLEFGKEYTDLKKLRYGKLIIFTDSDVDGSHIKGLIINFFDVFFPSLLKLDFIYEFITPIIKAYKKNDIKYFYKLNDYYKWKKTKQSSSYNIKYFKGLGTLEAFEAKMLFKDINKHLIVFEMDDFVKTQEYIDLVFNKKRADNRKEWLGNYEPGVIIDKFSEKTTYETFFEKEFIEFSMYDNHRSLPSVVDGFKPSQRKILYGLNKKNYKTEVKVSQLSGALIENTAYHHGNSSLEGTIIGMAQDLIGTNNINLLEPRGAFGTRLKGGKDAASSRYIFTQLSPISKQIFLSDDNQILNYLEDDGFPIEPDFYVPILPMVLVNGSDGIGTGWSTNIMNHNPNDVIKYLVLKIKDKTLPKIKPFYKNFKGAIIYDDLKNRYITQGKISKKSATQLRITELPIGMWNNKYYTILDKLEDDKIIKSYTKNDTDEKVDILITMTRGDISKIEEKLISIFKLETHFSMNNMVLFDAEGKIKHYVTVDEIVDDFYDVRLKFYQKRKDFIINKLEQEKVILINKMKFINEILKGNLEIQNKKRVDIEKKIEELKIIKIDDSYNYLLNMSLLSLSNEKLYELKTIFNTKKEEINVISKTSIKKMWLKELSILYKKLNK